MRPWRALVLVVMLAKGASAEPTPTERALARELFEQGRMLMSEKRYAQACAKLGESQRLDPAPGTLLNLAVCHEAEGKTATAWAEFNDALTLARRDARRDRVELAERHLKALEPRLSRLTIEVSEAARAEGLELSLDGISLGKPAWGTPIPVDPGKHRVVAAAPGRKPWSAEVTVGDDADRQSVSVPKLERAPEAAGKPAPKKTAPKPPPDAGSGQRTAGFIVGGVGVVALGVGGYFGLRAFSRWDERNAHCNDAGCDPAGVDAGDEAERAATFANIGIGVGLAGVAVGTYLVLSAGSGERPATAVAQPTADGRGLLLRYRKAF